MKLPKRIPPKDKNQTNIHLFHMLNKGFDDMNTGHELPLEDAFCTITRLRSAERNTKK